MKMAGNFERRRALRSILLASTILSIASIGAKAEEAKLDTIRVQGSSYETEGTGSYTSDLVSVGEKEVLTAREIPQSTHVITREKLEDGGYTSLDTTLRETPGVVVLSNDDGRSSLFSRGFEYDVLYFNGLPAPLSSIYGTQPDMAIVDHVEILRGPSGLFGGSGEPTGAINMRLKQAKDTFGGSASITGGSYDNYRGDVDVTSPLTENGRIRGRVVAAYQTQDSWVDSVDNEVGVGYGTVQADLTEDTTFTFSLSHMERDISPFNGLPTLADGTLLDVDVSTTTGTGWNNFENNVTDYIAELEHKFADGGHIKASTRYSDRDVDFLYGYAASAADTNGDVSGMSYLGRTFDESSFAADAHVSKPFELFGQVHNVIAGVDYRKVESDMQQGRGTIGGTFNLYNWNTSVAEPDVSYTTDTTSDPSQVGVYSQLRVNPVDRLTLIGGGRLSWYESSTTNNNTGAVTDRIDIDNEFTPYAGVTYDITDYATVYGSYTTIFQPQSDTDVSGNIIDPREGQQYEGGVKSQFFGNALNVTAAYFWIEDTNRAVSDPDNTGSSLAQGKVRVRGVDLEVSGNPLPNWSVMAGYTYTESENLDDGEVFSTYTPEHMVQLWSKYSFDSSFGMLDGLSLGGGMRAFSDFYSVSRGTTIEAPGYVVFDTFASYKINDSFKLAFNIDNILDEKYYERVGGTSVFNFYGKPRTFKLRLTTTF